MTESVDVTDLKSVERKLVAVQVRLGAPYFYHMRRIFFDTETTGISIKDKHRIIEIGCVETIDFKKTGRTFQAFLNPEREIDEGATRVHGKTFAMLKDKPKFTEIAKDFLNFIEDSELIAHNSSFDLSFVNYELSLINFPILSNEVVDSLLVARRRYPGQPASLDALCRRLGVDNSGREFHGALLDADLLTDVFIKICEGSDMTGSFEYKAKKEEKVVQIQRKASFPLRKFEISAEELEKHKEFLKSIGF